MILILGEDQECLIPDSLVNKRTISYSLLSIIIGITILILSITYTLLFLFYISFIFIFVGFVIIYHNKRITYSFIISNERIQVILVSKHSKKYQLLSKVIEKELFRIGWKDFEQLRVEKEQIKKNGLKKSNIVYNLKFIGKNDEKFFEIGMFHQEKQLEILLSLEKYCKYKNKEYIEKLKKNRKLV